MALKDTLRGALVAAAAAGLFACASTGQNSGSTMPASKTASTVKCMGANACKGHGQCGGAGHDCAGKNACKGKGWVKLSKGDCEAKGGTVK